MARGYDSGLFAGDDVALLRLGSDGPPDAAAADEPPGADPGDVGADIRTVGYGRTSGTGNDYGTRRQS
jgi:hypothetical protein